MRQIERTCPVPGCGKIVAKRGVGKHFRAAHPEYKWTRKTSEGTVCPHYYCLMPGCEMYIGGFDDMVRHYKQHHPEVLHIPKEDIKQPDVISESTLSVSDLDRLIEQVNKNVSILQEERKKNRELLQKCTAYAAQIVELQNNLAQETRNRY